MKRVDLPDRKARREPVESEQGWNRERSGLIRTLLGFFFLLALQLSLSAQPQISYIIPDIGTPGMNTYVEIVAPVSPVGAFYTIDAKPGLFAESAISVEFVNPLDSNRIVVSPLTVSWEGRLISCQFFVKPGAPLGPVPFRIKIDQNRSNVDTFFIVNPQPFGRKSGGGVIGSGGAMGTRSKRGAMIVDSLVLEGGVYTIDMTDPDPQTPGNQAFLPMVIISKGPLKVNSAATLSASANGKDGGPGGGGGGGYGSGGTLLGIFPIPGENNPPLGSGFAGGKSNVLPAPSPATSFGIGTGANSKSLNGVEANNAYKTSSTGIRGFAAAPGHPFDSDGRSGGAAALVINPTNLSFGQYYGGGGNGTNGQSTFPASQSDLNGQAVGNRQVVPISGGGGGSSGGPQDSVGAGSGGGLALYSQEYAAISLIQANGADGANGCANCGPASGNAAAGGAGGSILVGGKLGISRMGTVQVKGGVAGTAAPPATSSGTASGSGGSGRFRHDGRVTTGSLALTTDATLWTGPTTDTVTYVTAPLFQLKGTGRYVVGDQTNIQVYVRGEDSPWNYTAPYNATVSPDSTWQVEIALTTLDSIFYVFAVQLTPDNERTNSVTSEWTRVPSHVYSQAAANIFYYRPAPSIAANQNVRLDTLFCPDVIYDTIIYRNSGLGTLQVSNATLTGPTASRYTIISPSFPRTVAGTGSDTIIIRYNGLNPPYGKGTDTLNLYSNDPSPTKVPYQIRLEAVNGYGQWFDFDPDNPPTISFGQVRVGSSLDRSQTIRNIGTTVRADVVIDAVWIDPPNGDLVAQPPPRNRIIPNDSLSLTVRYTPSSEGQLPPAKLCVRFTEPCLDTVCFPITGEGVQSAVSLSKPSLVMDTPPCTTATILYDTLFIQNEGSADLQLQSLTITPGGTNFTIVEPASPPPLSPSVLIPGKSNYRVIVRYTPGSALQESATLEVVTDDSDTPLLTREIKASRDSVSITPSLHLIEITTSCPDIEIDTSLILRNSGNVDGTVTVRLADSTAFSLLNTPGPMLAANGIESLFIRFNPPARTLYRDTIFIESEPCGLKDTVVLVGDVSSSSFTWDQIPFGDVTVGTTSQRVATFTNNSANAVRIAGARVVPAGGPVIVSPTQTFPFTLQPGQQGSIQVTFIPTVSGPLDPGYRLEVIIDSLCSDTTYSDDITGNGLPGGLSINPNPLRHSLLKCETSIDTITVKNEGDQAIRINGIALNPDNGDHTVRIIDSPVPNPVLPAHDSVKIEVITNAAAPPDGTRSEVLEINTNSPVFGTVSVALQVIRFTEMLTATSGTFTTVLPGGSDVQMFQLTNTGSVPVAANTITVPPPFRIVAYRPPLPFLISPGASIEIDVEFAPTTSGTFNDSLKIDGLTRCGPIFIPITAIGEDVVLAETYWEDATGRPGERILMPLKLTSDLTGANVRSIEGDLLYNRKMLMPVGLQLQGTLTDGWNVTSAGADNEGYHFSLQGTTPVTGSGTLLNVEAVVLLGDSLTTQLASSDSSRFTSGGALMRVMPGIFSLDGYCPVGGDRLVRITNEFGVKAVAPNPVGKHLTIEFELVEDGPTVMAIYDLLGREVVRLLDEPMTATPHRIEREVDLSSGLYFIELRTRTQRSRLGIIAP